MVFLHRCSIQAFSGSSLDDWSAFLMLSMDGLDQPGYFEVEFLERGDREAYTGRKQSWITQNRTNFVDASE